MEDHPITETKALRAENKRLIERVNALKGAVSEYKDLYDSTSRAYDILRAKLDVFSALYGKTF